MTVLSSFNLKFSSITADSRKVQAGALFLAYPGVHSDGRNYIAQAIQAGAAAVAWESKDFAWNPAWQVANVGVSGLKDQVSEIAAEYYGQPSQKLSMVGVTGTNGKTSVSQWIAQALTVVGQKTAVIGTIGNGFVDAQNEASNTTPDAILLQGMLADFATQGAKAVAMEVSSHGLHQGRVNSVKFDVAVLTNLSRDHLDYHETMEEYAAAKELLFTWPGLGMSVINADDAFGQRIAAKLKAQSKSLLTYGVTQGDVRATDLKLHQHGLTMQVTTSQGDATVNAPVLGRFNAYNVLAVLATLLALKVSLTDAVAAIAKIKPVAGRMQQFGGDGKPLVVVDYAHTPDALEKVLSTLREQAQGKLICVFGCGGDRDAGKRPLMGRAAVRLADSVIVTSDNPRSEDPANIIAQVVSAIESAYLVEPDRAAAIKQAVQSASRDDIVLVAGKGHEDYQEIAGVKTPFSDAAVALAALNDYETKNAPMMQLSEAATALNAKLIGADTAFDSVGSDSRNIVAGQLFVAIKGENFDGNAFAAEAINKGAAAVMVSDAATLAQPALVVQDTRLALGALAKYWRSKFSAPLIGVTGSNGKTTTKEMLTAILAAATGDINKVHATYGNLNNDIGLPLTLLKIKPQHQYVVAEMGMNHMGEIDYLTHIAKPNVAVINNANTAHIGELGSRENIARAKGEIFAGLQEGGVAVINADNDFSDYWQTLNVGRKVVTFGLHRQADVTASYQEQAGVSKVKLTTPNGQVSFELKVEGVHNISNALAASATAYALGISNADIAQGLQNFGGVYGRLERKAAANGAVLIDDTYNANPDSMKAAIDVLAKQAGEKILVLGDMGELGTDAKKMHAEIGAYAKAAGLAKLYCLGELSKEMVAAFGAGAQHFETPEAVAAAVLPQLNNNSTVLVKGSRFMRMERVVSLLIAKKQ
ncbi:MAG TPA: bifunctional UDP-N-acetylmuramoyl-L-alanyl-D-glutamate--2,6-diaminopimelate ligase MurE/UDP-N-acetylmuramoyl-tripeptide--D-alanyl-D-alanine ligase MurF [Methylotenera sp.]